eukprot:m.185631 g.185631  ORF g.185631 m.185631 type:complete len:196 (-) comp15578_c0_seq2:689-1276(-)
MLNIAILALAMLANQDGDITLQRYNLTDKMAVCNDGSQSAYYFHSATNSSNSDVWVLHMQGGGWCWDHESCMLRAPKFPTMLTSSALWGETMTFSSGSILNMPDGRYGGANVAYLRYCTSDGYIGNQSDTSVSNGWKFHGRNVVEETVRQLVVTHGMGSMSTETFIFSGCSAGGVDGLICSLLVDFIFFRTWCDA